MTRPGLIASLISGVARHLVPILLLCSGLLFSCAPTPSGRIDPSGSKDDNSPWGIPKAPRILHRVACTIGYDPARREPLWVCYRVDKENVGLKGLTKRKFVPDPELSREDSAWDEDYRGSGFDRGHMAPFASVRRPSDSRPEVESCYFSNICPQRPNLNRGSWAGLEARIRRWAVQHGRVYVMVGPEFGPNPSKVPSGRVAIPEAFFMVVARMADDGPRVLAFVMAQDVNDPKGSFEPYLVSVREVEKATGLDFFSALPRAVQDRLETTRAQAASLN